MFLHCNVGILPYKPPPAGSVAALLMKPNSVARLCVNYYYPTGNSVSEEIFGSVYPANGSQSTLFNVFTEPNWIPISQGPNETVVYTITVPEGVRGFYWLFILGSCPSIPLAVGLSADQVNASDFPGLIRGICSCQDLVLNPIVQSYSGLQVVYLNLNR